MNYQLKTRAVRVSIDKEFGIFDTQTRFDICDSDGNVIDDAQGYGYKSPQAAHKAAAYKFKGGKQKQDAAKSFWKKHKDFGNKMAEMLEANFKNQPSNSDIVAFAAECGVTDFNPLFVKFL